MNKEDKIVGIGYNDMPDGCEGLPWDKSTENQPLNFSETKYAYGKNTSFWLRISVIKQSG